MHPVQLTAGSVAGQSSASWGSPKNHPAFTAAAMALVSDSSFRATSCGAWEEI